MTSLVPGSALAWNYSPPMPMGPHELNAAAGSSVLYEVQVRSANACRTDSGSFAQRDACARKISPPAKYRAGDQLAKKCGSTLSYLNDIKGGTLDDMLAPTTDYKTGITLKYIHDQVGANTVWLMPLFANNMQVNIPDPCDNLGSPYAVRDYMHAAGSLSQVCIMKKTDEYTGDETNQTPCWGTASLDSVIRQAHKYNMKVMLDVAFNHFGHDYLYYDYAQYMPIDQKIQYWSRSHMTGDQIAGMFWDFKSTFEQNLVNPVILDNEAQLNALAASDVTTGKLLKDIQTKCPLITGDRLVRTFGMWKTMLGWERAQFKCDTPSYLEYAVPGFYMGAVDGNPLPHPSRHLGDNFSNNWTDVKFAYHHEYHNTSDPARGDYYNAFARNREYFFRVLNFWVSRGVDGFRLDHASDLDSGIWANEWKYIFDKVNYYQWVRQAKPASFTKPIFLAEDFDHNTVSNYVFDTMTEGYVHQLLDPNSFGKADDGHKDAGHVERSLSAGDRFNGWSYVMRALETHDEKRLLDPNTGLDWYTGAGFYSLGVASRGTPMMLMGQEFGEPYGLGFRRSDYLRSRFEGDNGYNAAAPNLIDLYRKVNQVRRDPKNRSLGSQYHYYLRTQSGNDVDQRIFAQVKWSDNPRFKPIFTFNNLWNVWDSSGQVQPVAQTYYLPPNIGAQMQLDDNTQYKLVDIMHEKSRPYPHAGALDKVGSCRSGKDIKWSLYVKLDPGTRMQWMRLEKCAPGEP